MTLTTPSNPTALVTAAVTPVATATIYQVKMDASNVVIGTCASNLIQDGFVIVDETIYMDPLLIVGRCTYDGGVLTAYTPPVNPLLPQVIYKADIWRRCTDQEADTLIALLGTQTPRIQRIFNDASFILTTDDLYPTLLAGITQALSATRAAQILAPS